MSPTRTLSTRRGRSPPLPVTLQPAQSPPTFPSTPPEGAPRVCSIAFDTPPLSPSYVSGLLVMACVNGVHAHPRPPSADSVPGWLHAPRASRASAPSWGPGPPVAGNWGSALALHSAGPPRLETCARSCGAPRGALSPPFCSLHPGGGVRAGLASRFFLHHPSPMRRRWAWWLRARADDDSTGAGCTGCVTLLSAPPSVRLVCGLGLVERAANPAVAAAQVFGGV